MKSSPFQLIFLLALGVFALVAVLMFSGIIPGGMSPLGHKTAGEVIMWGTVGGNDIVQYFAEFNSTFKEQVRIKYEPKNPETYEEDLIEAFARGQGPDLFFANQQLLNRLAGKTMQIPFTVYPKRNFQDTFIEGAEVFMDADGIRAIPLLVDPLVMYYNRTMYSSAGIVSPPKTWQDFVATLKPINIIDPRGNITQTAAAMGEFRNVTNATPLFSAILFQAGTPIVAKDVNDDYSVVLSDTFGLASPPAEAATVFYLQFSNPTDSSYSWNRSMAQDKSLFTAERLAAYFGLSSELPDLLQKNSHLNLDAAIVPQKDLNRRITYGDVYGVVISKNAKDPELALIGAVTLASPENIQILSLILNLVPARRDLLSKTAEDSLGQVFRDSAVILRSWVDPAPAKTNRILGEALEFVQTGQALPLDAMRRAQESMNALFIKSGKENNEKSNAQ